MASGPSGWLDSLGAREGWVKFFKHPRVVSVMSAYIWPGQYKCFYKRTPNAVFGDSAGLFNVV